MPYASDVMTKPWSHLSLDNFDFQGQHLIMVLDIATTDNTIQTLTSISSEQGLPLSIRCDQGRNFVSDLFQ